MRKETNPRSEEPAKKSSHKHVSGSTPSQTKTKTKPLQGKDAHEEDAQEGGMNNGEIGHDQKKKNRP